MYKLLFQQGKFADLYDYFSPALQQQWPLRTFRKEAKIFQMQMRAIQSQKLSDNTEQWFDDKRRYIITVKVNGHEITDFQFHTQQQTTKRYSLPFKGRWYVVDEQASTYGFLPRDNKKILAPAEGTVVEVNQQEGYVVIRHAPDEYSYVANFSPTVAVNEFVAERCEIGQQMGKQALQFRVISEAHHYFSKPKAIRFQQKVTPGKTVKNRTNWRDVGIEIATEPDAWGLIITVIRGIIAIPRMLMRAIFDGI